MFTDDWNTWDDPLASDGPCPWGGVGNYVLLDETCDWQCRFRKLCMDVRRQNQLNHYRPVLQLLENRIVLKHEQKGLSYQTMPVGQIHTVLDKERRELWTALIDGLPEHIIEESLDVAISALLLADRVRLQVAKETEPKSVHDAETGERIGSTEKLEPPKCHDQEHAHMQDDCGSMCCDLTGEKWSESDPMERGHCDWCPYAWDSEDDEDLSEDFDDIPSLVGNSEEESDE